MSWRGITRPVKASRIIVTPGWRTITWSVIISGWRGLGRSFTLPLWGRVGRPVLHISCRRGVGWKLISACRCAWVFALWICPVYILRRCGRRSALRRIGTVGRVVRFWRTRSRISSFWCRIRLVFLWIRPEYWPCRLRLRNVTNQFLINRYLSNCTGIFIHPRG
jgi:hypothetical protein